MPKLTPIQKRFPDEYLKDMNPARAAVRAGCKPRGAEANGRKMLNHPEIAAIIQEKFTKLAEKIEITPERTIKELAKVAFANAGDYFDFDTKGVKDLSSLTRDQFAAVGEIIQKETAHSNTVRVRLLDKLSALDKLMRHLGQYKDIAPIGEGEYKATREDKEVLDEYIRVRVAQELSGQDGNDSRTIN